MTLGTVDKPGLPGCQHVPICSACLAASPQAFRTLEQMKHELDLHVCDSLFEADTRGSETALMQSI